MAPTSFGDHVATLPWESVKMKLTLPKWGLGSLLGLPKLQSSIVEVKTSRIRVLFISLESYRSVDVENGLACAIWIFAAHIMAKRKGPGVKLAIWLPTTKSRELTRPQCVQVECDTSLESSWGELQVCLRPHPNQRFEQRVMTSQSPGSPNRDSFETPPWESWDKKPFSCKCYGEMQSILYGGRWWLPLNPGRGESCESKVARGLS
jgi:hypothetical protein